MEQTNLKEKIVNNKEKLLEFHKNFYANIDKIKSMEDSTKRFIENAENFVGEKGTDIKFKEILMFFMMEKMTSGINDIMGFGLNK